MDSVVDTSGPSGETGEDEVAELGYGLRLCQVKGKCVAQIVDV